MVSIELQAPSNYLDELTHVDMIRHQEFRFIQDWKLLLTFVSFYYYRDFGRMLLSDEPDIFYSLFEGSALFEGFLGRHVAAGWAAAAGSEACCAPPRDEQALVGCVRERHGGRASESQRLTPAVALGSVALSLKS